jgi:hypothetical protein
MSLPAQPDEPCRIRLRPLPEYEPEDCDARRWSSLRPAVGPQLALVPPPPPPDEPPLHPATLAAVFRRVLEVLDGRRPATQLRTLLPDVAFEALLTRLRTTPAGRRHVLRRLRTCFPTPHVVEVSAVVVVTAPGHDRVTAAAARFERDGERWLCTVLRFL